jgi:hypothetical protein
MAAHPGPRTVVPIRHKPAGGTCRLAVPKAAEAAGDFIPFGPAAPRLSSLPHPELARSRVVKATAPLPPRASSLPSVGRSVLAVLPSAFGHGASLLTEFVKVVLRVLASCGARLHLD